MDKYSIKNICYRIYQIRAAFKEKRLDFILSNPLNAIIFILIIIRALALRLIPRLTKMYFIRRDFSEHTTEIRELNYDFSIYSEFSAELNEFSFKRCNENNNYYFDSYTKEIAHRLHKGMSACALLLNGKIVSMFFTSKQDYLVDQVNYIYTPENNEILITDIYTLIEYRKKGLYSLLLQHAINYYKEIGINTFVMWIMKHNRATIKAQLKVGFKEIFQTVQMFSWLGIEKTKVNPAIKLLKKL